MIRRHHLSGVPFSSVRRQLLGCSAIAALLAAFAMGPAFADEISAGPTSDRWAKHPALQGFDLTGKDLPPRLFLVRTRGGLPETEGVKVHGVRGGVFLVSGDAAVVQGLAQRGCAVIPLTDGSPPRPSQSPREWKRIEHPDPAIVDMVSQVGWEKLLEKIQWLVDYRTRYTRADNHQEIA